MTTRSSAPPNGREGRAAPALVACRGAPRDIGLDQGRACAGALRERFGRLPAWRRLLAALGRSDPRERRIARDLARHFPHHAEALEGLGSGARVPGRWLIAELVAELAREAAARPLAVAAGRGLLARELSGRSREPSDAWLVRRSAPEGLFASLELTRPWLVGSLAGVNERGLAVSVVAGADGERDGEGVRQGACAAPAALLAQDCLERFEALEAALEWCSSRPAGGRAALLLADAHGEMAGLEIAGDRRRVLRPSAGLLVSGGLPGGAGELRKQLADAPPSTLDELLGSLPGRALGLDAPARRLVVDGRSFSLA